MSTHVGGHSGEKTDAEGLAKINAWRAIIEAKAGSAFAHFEAVSYTTQVVAGTNWNAKIRVSPDATIQVRVFEPLPHTGAAPEVKEIGH